MPPSPTPDTCWLWLVRHGMTANNRARPPRLQGQGVDAELSPEGLDQAQRTARLLSDQAVDVVFSSPLRRAQETARIIAEPHGLAVQTVEQLTEVDVGQWEGLHWNVIQRDWPEAYRAFMADAGVNPYFGGENLADVQARVTPAFERLLAENLGRRMVVVGHSIVNRSYLAGLMGVPLDRYRSLPQDNCGVNLLKRRKNETKLITLNWVGHLDDQP